MVDDGFSERVELLGADFWRMAGRSEIIWGSRHIPKNEVAIFRRWKNFLQEMTEQKKQSFYTNLKKELALWSWKQL